MKQKVHVAKKTVDPAFERKREQFRAVQKAVDKFNDATEGQRKALRGLPPLHLCTHMHTHSYSPSIPHPSDRLFKEHDGAV